MSEPITTIIAFISAKFAALFWSLGGALITLSFIDESSINKKRSFTRGLANLLATWFVGFGIGQAVDSHINIPSFTGAIYVISTITGLLLIGGIYKFAHGFKENPQQFISNMWSIWKRK